MNLYTLVCSICSFIGCHSGSDSTGDVVVERYFGILCSNVFLILVVGMIYILLCFVGGTPLWML